MIVRLFDEESVAAGQSVISSVALLRSGRHVHALQYGVSGSGRLDISTQISCNNSDWIDNGIKGKSITITSGPDTNGKDIIPLSLDPGDFFRVKLLEIGGVSVIVVNLWFLSKK